MTKFLRTPPIELSAKPPRKKETTTHSQPSIVICIRLITKHVLDPHSINAILSCL